MTLQDEIESGRQTIKTESLSMSIGEIVNLYRAEELVIRPEFQRLFRWDEQQKSRLIESILLGIPLPSIFVMQRSDGVWEIIDGLQRISTILEFMGELRAKEDGKVLPASQLKSTAYLKSLEGITFNTDDSENSALTPGQQISLKRSKIDVKILLPESDDTAKYELFDRLNAGGSRATSQEVRSAQIIMRDSTMFSWLETLRDYPDFQSTLSITDRLYDEGYDMELVCRFLALRNSTDLDFRSISSMDDFISEKMYELTTDGEFDRNAHGQEFFTVFRLLNSALADDTFRRFDPTKDRFLGGFSVSSFESITVGVAVNLIKWSAADSAALRLRVQDLWSNPSFKQGSGSGVRASTRIPRTIPAAIAFFQ